METQPKPPLKDRPQPNARSFRNRIHAADLICKLVAVSLPAPCLVLASTGSSLPMAKFLASKLKAPFDLSLVQTFAQATDGNANAEVGYVSELGGMYMPNAYKGKSSPDVWSDTSASMGVEKLKNLRRLYTPGRAAFDPFGRSILLIDDGSSSKPALIATLRGLAENGAKKIVVASPVISCETVERLLAEKIEIVCLKMTTGQSEAADHYESFLELSPMDLIELLDSNRIYPSTFQGDGKAI